MTVLPADVEPAVEPDIARPHVEVDRDVVEETLPRVRVFAPGTYAVVAQPDVGELGRRAVVPFEGARATRVPTGRFA